MLSLLTSPARLVCGGGAGSSTSSTSARRGPSASQNVVEQQLPHPHPTSSAGAASLAGPRPENQDAFRMGTEVYAVFDGHGEHGRDLARALAEKFEAMVFRTFRMQRRSGQTFNPEFGLREAFVCLDAKVRMECSSSSALPSPSSMTTCGENRFAMSGACAAVAVLFSHQIVLAHVGDCKALVFRGSSPEPRYSTTAHTTASSPEVVRIKKAGGWVDANGRLNGRLLPTRAFGDFRMKRMTNIVSSEPDVVTLSRTPQDMFLVLLTDGITDVLTDEDVWNVVVKACHDPQYDEDPDTGAVCIEESALARRICETALARGATDNCTAVFVTLNEEWKAVVGGGGKVRLVTPTPEGEVESPVGSVSSSSSCLSAMSVV